MQTQAPPEAAGPGVERGDGAIIYGDETMPRVVIENLRDPEERARDLASYSGQCAHCQGISPEVLRVLRSAIAVGPPR